MTPMTVSVGTKPLTIDDVGAIAERRAIVTLSPDGREAVRKARAVVDRLVDEKIPAYGITTGVGSQKDFSVDPEAIAAELGLGSPAQDADFSRLRRSFAFANHPDRVAPHLRQRAMIRMQIANMLIDEAKRKSARGR